MTKTTQYKNTPIGPIPKDWEVKKLGELGEFKNGINKDKEDFGFGFPMVNLMDIFGINILHQTSSLSSLVNASNNDLENYNLKKGDVIFVRSSVKPSGVGLTTLINNDFDNVVYSGFLIRFRSNSIFLDHNFKTHCFYADYFRNKLISKSTISANTNINQVALSSLPLIIPPLPEQQKIAEILSTWDKAIQDTDAIIKKLEDRNKALAFSLLTGKKRVKGFEDKEFIKSLANEVFKSVSIKNNPEDSILLSATQEFGMIPRDMIETRVTMPSGSLKTYKLVEKGDFVISLRSFQGGIEYSEYTGVVSPAYTVLKSINPINDDFYKYYFKSEDLIGRLSVAVIGIRDGKNISYDDFSTIVLPNPSLEEQNAIAEILNTANQEVKQYQQKLQALKLQKKGLMQQLLTGKVRTV